VDLIRKLESHLDAKNDGLPEELSQWKLAASVEFDAAPI
jgi:hypothetical protein